MTAQIITQALLEQAQRRPHATAYRLLGRGGDAERISYAELLGRSEGVAACLQRRGMAQGDRVLVCLATGATLLATVWGVMLAGGVCVPVYPPQAARGLGRWKEQVRAIVRVAQPRGAVVDDDLRTPMAAALEEHGEDLFTLVAADLVAGQGRGAVAVEPSDLAFIQFTSGTTRAPRGVAISHAALMANARELIAAMGLGPSDRSVSWLPPYHDMGLVGHLLTPVVCGAEQALMAPSVFLRRPERWLQLIAELGATQTTAPNSAYAICVRRVPPSALGELSKGQPSLSSLRWALNGAELVQPDTLEAFAEVFAPTGFDPRVFRPVYGMAEATLAVCFGPPGGARIDRVKRRPLARGGVAEPARAGDVEVQRFASVGPVIAGHELEVRLPDGSGAFERQVGEIHFRGPSLMQGYFNNPQATREALVGGWLRTGDLGYLADGELYVTGRVKELIIKGGRNYLPADIEAVCHDEPRLRAGRAVAFGLPNRGTGTEDLVLVAEVREPSTAGDLALGQRLAAAVLERAGVRPDRVELLAPGALPKTTSGKLQRARVREAYSAGEGLAAPRPRVIDPLAERARAWVDRKWFKLKRRLGWQ